MNVVRVDKCRVMDIAGVAFVGVDKVVDLPPLPLDNLAVRASRERRVRALVCCNTSYESKE